MNDADKEAQRQNWAQGEAAMNEPAQPAPELLREDELETIISNRTYERDHHMRANAKLRTELEQVTDRAGLAEIKLRRVEEWYGELWVELERANKAKSGSDYLANEYLEHANGLERLLKKSEAALATAQHQLRESLERSAGVGQPTGGEK